MEQIGLKFNRTIAGKHLLRERIAKFSTKSVYNAGTVTINPSIKYKTGKGLRISVSPYVLKIRGVTSQAIADKDIFFQDKDNRILSDGHYKKMFQEQLGAGLQIWYTKKFGK